MSIRGQTCDYQGEGWEERIIKELGINMYRLLYLKQITNKVLLYRVGNSVLYRVGNSLQCYVVAWMEESLGENG